MKSSAERELVAARGGGESKRAWFPTTGTNIGAVRRGTLCEQSQRRKKGSTRFLSLNSLLFSPNFWPYTAIVQRLPFGINVAYESYN